MQRQRAGGRRGITSHKAGRRWEHGEQLSSYSLNLIDTTMKLFRQEGGGGGKGSGNQADGVRGRQEHRERKKKLGGL